MNAPRFGFAGRSLALLTLAGVLGVALATGAELPPRLPVEVLFSTAEISALRFSPNGRYLAALVPVERRQNLIVMDLEQKSKHLLTKLTDEGIVRFVWANDDRILFYRDEGGRENYGLYAVNRVGGAIDRLAYAGEQIGTAGINTRFAGLLRRDRHDPGRYLILAHDTVRDRPDVASMDIRTGVYRVVTRNPGKVSSWVLDWNDVTRFGIVSESGRYTILYRDQPGQDWKELGTFDEEGEGWWPIEFDGDNRTVYVASDIGRRTVGVFKYDTVTHQFGALVHGDDTYDVVGWDSDVISNRTRKSVVGLSYHAEKEKFVYWDETYARRQAIIDRSLPDMINAQVDSTEDGSRVVVYSRSDREPGVYYLFDEQSKRLEELAVVRPRIEPTQMAAMTPVQFRARDGRTLHGYLTLPVGRPARGLPLVVHPHGGPYGPRDTWEYNAEVQYYANRGLAVLQIDFRGSGGYGIDHLRAGFCQWGLAMQDDLTDGVKWAIEQGIADPKRIVISGASYGGYAAMAGLTFTPELYCAGINYVGVTDLVLRGRHLSRRPEMAHWHRVHIGDLDHDRQRLKDTSPVNFAERIRVPVLMAYGRNDPRVPIEHGYDMERAMKRAGKAFEMIIEADEGHGFRKEEAAIAFFKRVDQFLARVLPELEAPPAGNPPAP